MIGGKKKKKSSPDARSWFDSIPYTPSENQDQIDPKILARNKAQVESQVAPQRKIVVPDVLYSGLEELKNIYETPGKLWDAGVDKLQTNPISGVLDMGQGIVQGIFAATGIPQLFSGISTGVKSVFGEQAGLNFDAVLNLPSEAVTQGTKLFDKVVNPETQHKIITQAVQGLLSTGRPEFQIFEPLLTEQGQNELTQSINEVNRLGATLLSFNAIAKSLPEKVAPIKVLNEDITKPTIRIGGATQKDLVKAGKTENAINQRNVPESSKPEYQGTNQGGLPEKTGDSNSATPRQEVGQEVKSVSMKDVENFRVAEEKKLNEDYNKGNISFEDYDKRVNELRNGESTAREQTFRGEPLNSNIVPGLSQFVEQDVIPTFQKAVKGVIEGADAIKKVFAPTTRGENAQKTASIIREENARFAQKREVAFQSFKKAQEVFGEKTDEQNINYMDGIEKGRLVGTPEEKTFALSMRSLLDNTWNEVVRRNGSEAYIENYFPHLWDDPESAADVFAKAYSKRPLEGSKGFLKERKIPTIKEGLDLGLKLKSTNPVDNVLARVNDMNRYVMAKDIWGKFKENELVQFVKSGDKAPKGYIKVNDKIARVMQFSESEKGFIQRGEYWMPEQAGTILNNFLSPGLKGKVGYELLRQSGNLMNQVQLGLSAFHFAFTSIDAATSRVALGVQQFSEGKPIKALKNVLSAPASPITNLIKGNKLLESYYGRNPELTLLVDDLLKAGGRVKMDSFYKNSSVESFWKAWRGGNVPGALVRSPFALVESLAKPLMEYLVPRQKLGVFSDLAKNINEEAIRKGWTDDLLKQRLQEAWDSVDNRMGQLVYDNLFWNKTVKDLGMASVRSLGWNIGDIRELGGGAIDFLKQGKNLATGKETRMTPRMAYTVSLPIVAGTIGGMIHYLYNGEAPQELKDYFYPKTGKKMEDGTDERVALPTYMKDVYAVKQDLVKTALHKTHPMINSLINMMQNEDYYGFEIRNPEDPLVKQLGQIATYTGEQFIPFSVRNYQQRLRSGDTKGEALQSLYGITPAPKYISNSPIQNEIKDLYEKRTGKPLKPLSQKEIYQKKKDIKDLIKLGRNNEAKDKAVELLQDEQITIKGLKNLFAKKTAWDSYMFQRLPVSDKAYLFEKMDKEEKAKYLQNMSKDALQKLLNEIERQK